VRGNDDIHTSVVMSSIQLHSQVGQGVIIVLICMQLSKSWLTVICSQKLTRPPVVLPAGCTIHGISEINCLKIII